MKYSTANCIIDDENKIQQNSVYGENVKLYDRALVTCSKIGNNSVIGENSFIKNSILGKQCTIERRGVVVNSNIGDYSYTSYNTVVKFAKIKKFCSISWNVGIGGADHLYNRMTTHPFPYIPKFGMIDDSIADVTYDAPVEIGNDVWIASNVCVLRSVKIGDGAVIGAGAVVTHDVGSYEIWAGVPAKKIGQRFSDEIISELLDLQWWDLDEELLSSNVGVFRDDGLTLQKIAEFKSRIQKSKMGGGYLCELVLAA